MQNYDLYVKGFMGLLIIGFFFRNYEKKQYAKVQELGFCLIISLIVSTIFDLSPFNQNFINQDSSVFLYIGERMRAGYVPYRDLFDHKGILLYVIQYLGELLPFENYAGVWVLEIVNMWVTAWLLLKISKLFTNKTVTSYISLIGVLIICGFQFYSGGNYTEEWALPWVCLAIYIFLKYFKTGTYRFSDIVWLGIGFAVVALLRVNMVTVWAAMMPVVIIKLILERKYKDIGHCAAGFLTGLLIITIPVLIYTIVTGCLDDMITCYIRFNFVYSQDAGEWNRIMENIQQFLKLVPYACGFGMIALIFHIRDQLYLWNAYAFFFSLPFAYMSGRFDLNYGIILIPFFMPMMVCGIESVYTLLGKLCKWALPNKLVDHKLTIAAGIAGCFFVVAAAFHLMSEPVYLGIEAKQIRDYILENTDPEDDVLVVGSQGMLYYFLTDRRTENKYFYQTPPVKLSDELCEDFIHEMKTKPSDTMVVLRERDFWMQRTDNYGDIFQYLETQAKEGSYLMEDYGHFFTYQRIQ